MKKHLELKKIGPSLIPSPKPAFIAERLQLFDQLYAAQQAKLKSAPQKPIKIILKDGRIIEGIANVSSPYQIAKQISKKLAENAIVARIQPLNEGKAQDMINIEEIEPVPAQQPGKENSMLWDLLRPLEDDCRLDILDVSDPAAQRVFWHSSAHLMGEVLENEFGGLLCVGPPLQSGFYYDIYLGGHSIHPQQFELIRQKFEEICHSAQEFHRVEVSKAEALELFKYNPFKCDLINRKIPENGRSSAYRCGSLIDLCSGPHIPFSNLIKAFKVMKGSGAYWLGNAQGDELQRIYGISFASAKELKDWEKQQEELEKRDHRILGPKHSLFEFHPFAPGSPLFFPPGAHIYNKLMDFLRKQYRLRGYSEVISPNIFNNKLFQISGHVDKYAENMYFINDDKGSCCSAVKPMNCPAHCLMFGMHQRSYRDLPIRYADFGVLHRHEPSGSLGGIFRTLRFVQDDAHIFCSPDQIFKEVFNQLKFVEYLYKLFGFSYELGLSTRPDRYLGSLDLWEKAEGILADVLNKFGKPWKVNHGDGAFYGPKIDIILFDALGRGHQCATLQLDFVFPLRFNLQ
jgi:threonyl-tRNA synthetase